MLVVALRDHLAVADEALAACKQALEQKWLAILPGGHFDAYRAAFDQSATAAREWFVEHWLRDRSLIPSFAEQNPQSGYPTGALGSATISSG